jgi:hypothetical protein
MLIFALPTLAGQAPVASADLERLQDRIDVASRDVAQLESRDARAASQLRRDLDEVREEVTYLRVKLRKHESVGRQEYWTLRDRIEDIQARAAGRPSPATRDADRAAPSDRSSTLSEIPAGTEFDVRLQSALSSATAHVEDRFDATTLVDLRDGDRLMVPSGSVMHGIVNSVTKTTRIERKGKLGVAFERITIGTRSYPIHASVQQAIESEGIRGEVGKIGAGAGVGAVIGAILGGAKGAAIGILVGGGGVTAATEGKDVELQAGTILRVRLDAALSLE